MNLPINTDPIKQYFGEKLDAFGATPQGADWNSDEAQNIRFQQLLRLCDSTSEFTILDYGCGYGALINFLNSNDYKFKYIGFDILPEMIAAAHKKNGHHSNCAFTSQESELDIVDYVVESGIFNIRLDFHHKDWTEYVIQTLHKMDVLSRRGFAFNLLTSYSEPEYMKPQLYYADPCYYFDYCKRNFSRNVALYHDYNLYDFTILVRKSENK